MSFVEPVQESDHGGQESPEQDQNRIKARTERTAKPRSSQPRARRSISTLSAGQLARKRAHDREAQRALRQKTRDHIDRLELRIKNLSNEDSQITQLEDLKRRNAQLEEEITQLQQDIQNANSSSSSSSTHSKISHAVHYGSSSSVPSRAKYSTPEVLHDLPAQPDFGSVELSQHDEKWFPDTASTISSDSETVPLKWISKSPIQGPYHPTVHTSRSNVQPAPARSMNYNIGELGFPTDRISFNTTSAAYVPRFVLFRQPPRTVYQTPNPVEGIMSGIIQRQTQILSEGADIYTVLGPERPDLSVLFSPKRAMTVHPLARALAQATRFATFAGNFERITLAIPHYPLMKWQIMQTVETFMDVPWFFVPTETQSNISHPIWMDFLYWPKLRDAVIINQDAYDGLEFINFYCNSLNPNWPHSKRDAVYWDNEGLHPNDALVMHCLDLHNWSIDEPFQLRFPELRPFCKFTEYC